MSPAAVRTAIFTVVVPGTLAGAVPLLAFRHGPPANWAGAALVTAGVAVYLWSATSFVRFGEGTPNPLDAPRRVVASGPYRFVRNPMYIAVVGTIAGEAVLFASWALAVYALGLAIAFHLFVVGYEEPTLRARFGAAYWEYTMSVRRWMPRR